VRPRVLQWERDAEELLNSIFNDTTLSPAQQGKFPYFWGDIYRPGGTFPFTVTAHHAVIGVFDNRLLAFVIHPYYVHGATINTYTAPVTELGIDTLNTHSNYLLVSIRKYHSLLKLPFPVIKRNPAHSPGNMRGYLFS
jgi:hypothetical protein